MTGNFMAPSPTTTLARATDATLTDAVPEKGRYKTHPPTLAESSSLTPALYEKRKTAQQKAEDVIYTLNHAITCLSVTDLFVVGAVANLWKGITGKKPGWHHDHGEGEYGAANWLKDKVTGKQTSVEPHVHAEGEHHHHGPELTPNSSGKDALKKAWHTSKGWLLSEAIGDLGAVPVVVGIQRLFPNFMDTLRKYIEPYIGGVFRKNTKRAAVNWGAEHGKAADSQEVVAYAQELYEYEMRHMPQMACWTVLSIALNLAAIKTLGKVFPQHFEEAKFTDFMANKSIGAVITGSLVLGIRGLTPGGAHKWDRTIGKHVILPITKVVGAPFGVKTEDVEQFHKREEILEKKVGEKDMPHAEQNIDAKKIEQPDWQGRLQPVPEVAPAAVG